jgi:hypothetical protein
MTAPPDFRALCSEMLKAWDSDEKYCMENHDAVCELLELTRAALDTPPPTPANTLMVIEHTPPVPPDALKWQWYQRRTGTEFEDMDLAAAWGWEQAIPEREELARLLAELANALRLNVPEAWDWPVPTGVSILHDRARAAAERLRGGGE